MCIVVFSFREHLIYKLIVAGNRDEYVKRESLPFGWHKLQNGEILLSPLDLSFLGTWFGITKKGKIAFLTNYRNPKLFNSNAVSRGKLVWEFFESLFTPKNFIEHVNTQAYNPFNFIFGNVDELYYFSNVTNQLLCLKKGIYGLSNNLLDTPWPKLLKAKKTFENIIKSTSNQSHIVYRCLEMLSDDIRFEDDLPNTSIGIEIEKVLSSIFINSDDYKTHSSYVLLVDYENNSFLYEINHLHRIISEFKFSLI